MWAEHLILIASVVAGAATVLIGKLDQPRHLKLLTAFTGAYLMGLTCLHLLPDLFANAQSSKAPHWQLGAFILGGFFIQIVLENFSRGLEHGHVHTGHRPPAFGMIAGLCLHAFLEATPIGTACHVHDHAHDNHLILAAIAVHKFPVAIVLFAMLLQSGITRQKSFVILAVFAAMAPLGVAAGRLPALSEHHHWLMAMVIGIFMHVATTILFESEEGHRVNLKKAIAILLGVGTAILTIAIHTH